MKLQFRIAPGICLAGSLVVSSYVLNGFAAQSAATASVPLFTHPRDISNPYLPLNSLKQDILEGRENGKQVRIERTARPELRRVFRIGSQNVETLAVEDRELENGVLAEIAIDYFAQADNGTVYYLGEKVDEYKNGKVVGHEGEWMYGVDTKKLTPILPGNPKVADRFRSEDVSKIIFEEDEVISLTETVSIPLGTFHGCLKIKETLADRSIEHKYYVKGIGCIREVPAEGDITLRSHNGIQSPEKKVLGTAASSATPSPNQGEASPVDPLARDALSYVGADPTAEAYWFEAINDPSLPPGERQNLIEDLNEDGLSDPKHPSPADLPLIMNRLWLIETAGPWALDEVNADAFQEAYKDLLNLADLAVGRGEPVK